MDKAYDRVEWTLTKVLEKMGLDVGVVDRIWRSVAKSWYSIIINDQSYGLFHSTREKKQGDPSSRGLFIHFVEALSRDLNSLFFMQNIRFFIFQSGVKILII